MTTPPIMSVTDELLSEIEDDTRRAPPYAFDRLIIEPADVLSIISELRRLRAENAELANVIKDVKWRVFDTTDQLQAYSHSGDRLYGLDEWSVPIRNLNMAIGILGKAIGDDKC
jgi:hypothetical protein